MNKRQRKKLFKQTLIKVRKLHPQEGDVICFQFDPEQLYVDVITEFERACLDNQIFGEANIAIVPSNIKKLDKEEAQIYIDKLQSIVEKYVNKQGCTLGKDAERLQKLLHSIQYCYIHGVLTESQNESACKKFRKQFQKALYEK